MNQTIQLIIGILAGLIGNATQEKLKLVGYGMPAFTAFGKSFGYDDVIGIGAGVALLFYKPSRVIGYGVIIGMLYTKLAEGTTFPQLKL